MAEGISLPPGAFAAAKAGSPQPTPAPKADAAPVPAAAPKPKTELRKKEPEIVKKAAPQLSNDDNAPEPKEMTPAERKIWKLKDGAEEFEFDATDEEAVKREVQKARAANKRFDEAARLRQEAEQAYSMLKDPEQLRRILQDPRVGLDVKKFAEDYVWEQIQQQQREAEWAKDPAAKQRWEDGEELKKRRDADARAQEEGISRLQREAQARHETAYEQKFIKAMEGGGIPKTPEAFSRMAELTMIAVDKNIDLTAEEIAQVYRDELDHADRARYGGATGEQLARMIGEDGLKRLREYDLGRLKNPQGNPFPRRSEAKRAATGKAPPAPARQSGSEWKEDLVKNFLNRNR